MSGSERKPRRLRLCLVGWGAIARRVAQLLSERGQDRIEIVAVAVRDAAKPRDDLPGGAQLISRPDELVGMELDMVVEAAGRASVAPWGETALRAGRDFVVSSSSAFCDEELLSRFIGIAEETGGRIAIPPGAIGGMDVLSAAALLPLDMVEHSIVKPPAAWRGTSAESLIDLDSVREATTFFRGSARQAAECFPQNANVAVISALAGIGLDRTQVLLVADPSARRNVHQLQASGAFGSLHLRLENEPLATNPKSSEMTALNLVRHLESRVTALLR